MLCKKFKLTPSNTTIRPHAWFTSGAGWINVNAKYCTKIRKEVITMAKCGGKKGGKKKGGKKKGCGGGR